MAKKASATTSPPKPSPAPDANSPRIDYTVLARRYRPALFTELIGQEAIARALQNAIQQGRVAHAYLFHGARGVGKTSTARILAKCLNCVQGPTINPCGACESCQAIAVGEDVDVVEIDGASNRNIDDIRELRSNAQYRPQRSRYKIYIIDEVHSLTKESFNALLKTLEEPPPHVKFIFATTEMNKVPITILSRCQRFEFGGIGVKQIQDRLRHIVDQEKVEAEPEALALLARRAGGSMRDAQSLLDQAMSFGQGPLTLQDIQLLLGTANDEQVAALTQAILSKDGVKALQTFNEACGEGVQIGEFLDQMIDFWRQLMLAKAVDADSDLLEHATLRQAEWSARLQTLTLDQVLAGIDLWVAAKARLKTTSHGRVLVEATILRLCQLSNLQPLADVVRQLQQWVETGPAPGKGEPAPKASPPRFSGSAPPRPPEAPPPSTQSLPLTEGNLQQVWQQTLRALPPLLSQMLSSAERHTLVPPATVMVTFTRATARNLEYCQDAARLTRIEETLKKVTGQGVALRFELASQEGETPQGPVMPKAASARKWALQQPLIQSAMEHLGAEIVRIDDDYGANCVPAAQRLT